MEEFWPQQQAQQQQAQQQQAQQQQAAQQPQEEAQDPGSSQQQQAQQQAQPEGHEAGTSSSSSAAVAAAAAEWARRARAAADRARASPLVRRPLEALGLEGAPAWQVAGGAAAAALVAYALHRERRSIKRGARGVAVGLAQLAAMATGFAPDAMAAAPSRPPYG